MWKYIVKVFLGLNFVTIVTYYPSSDDYSWPATIFRVSTTTLLAFLMATMILTADGFAMMNLMIVKYKFITLRHYFKKLGEDVHEIAQKENAELASKRLNDGLIEGILMHKELLRLTKVFYQAFGNMIALQLAQSLCTAVTLLLNVALSDNVSLTMTMKTILFVVGLYSLLGMFLCHAGEITYQASLLADLIFYSGWHLCSSSSPFYGNIRRLTVFSCAQAQRPVTMKAFKMVDLTYATFLKVIKGTYSVFALFYTQNK